MKCRRCGSENVIVQAVAEKKKRGFIKSILWLFLSVCTFGLIIWIPLLMQKGTKTVTYAICQNCGRKWEV